MDQIKPCANPGSAPSFIVTSNRLIMKKYHLLFTICLLIIQISFAQEFKIDPRTQMEKENPMEIHHPDETTILDLLEMMEVQGIRMNKFD